MSSQVYEIIKTIYTNPSTTTESDPSTRISVLQNTLGQLRLANIATLDAITTHFTRLIELTSADEDFVTSLANNLAPCVLRPRLDTHLTMHERHAYRLVRDLFAHKEAIFGELKRASALTHTTSGAKATTQEARVRGISTDESHRREAMEARNKAIANRSRAPSPAPPTNGRHRRDRSSGPVESTRFPILPSTSPTNERKPANRTSLDVPDAAASSSSSSTTTNNYSTSNHNTSATANNNAIPILEHNPELEQASSSDPLSSETTNGTATTALPEKKDSLSRSSRFPPARKHVNTGSLSRTAAHVPGDRSSLASLDGGGGEKVGVQLIDAPMDD